MARNVFYSFHYKPDNVRAAQVRNMGVIDGNVPAKDNDWETITKGKDPAIEKWIKDQMEGRSCAVVLVGADTAGRKWINYEIIEAWKKGMGVCGVRIHNLKNFDKQETTSGANPFSLLTFGAGKFDAVVRLYDPPYSDSQQAYGHIKQNIAAWIEKAIEIRAKY
jgi:MTH538 TIR-like domain (DUF1863)